MAVIEPLLDLSDLEVLSLESGLYLKPYAKLNISIKVPVCGEESFVLNPRHLTEQLVRATHPFRINSLALVKSTLEIVRFSCEVECLADVGKIVSRLNDLTIKLEGLGKGLKVKANVVKTEFPSKEEWECYFKGVRSSGPGERADTLHLSNLPTKWFTKAPGEQPSEIILLKIFQQFGPISAIDIPSNDPYRHRMKGHKRNHLHSSSPLEHTSHFDAYVQFREVVGFANAMDTLRDKKLVKRTLDAAYSCQIKVTFDKSKHLSFWAIGYREIERNALIEADQVAATQKQNKQHSTAPAPSNETHLSHRENHSFVEEHRDKLKNEDSSSIDQQRLESFRLLKFLLNKLKERHILTVERNNNEKMNQEAKGCLPPGVNEDMLQREKELRERLLARMRLKSKDIPQEPKSSRKVRKKKSSSKKFKRKHKSAHSSSSDS